MVRHFAAHPAGKLPGAEASERPVSNTSVVDAVVPATGSVSAATERADVLA
jgi:hypothetical protein